MSQITKLLTLALFFINNNAMTKKPGHLEVTPIYEDSGFTIFRLENRLMVANYTKILHVIDLNEYRNIVKQIEQNIKTLNVKPWSPSCILLKREINTLKNNIETIIPHTHRSRRGLLNIIGTGLKFLTGKMDADDANEIYNHLENLKTNSKNLIDQSNKQVVINSELINALENIKNHVNKQSDTLNTYINEVANKSNWIVKVYENSEHILQIYADISQLNQQIEKIKGNIMLSRLDILGHDILTFEETTKFNITVEALPFIKSSTVILNETIVFVILIPNFSNEDYFNALILPFPNHDNEELDIPNEKVIISEQKVFNFEKGISSTKKLKPHKNQCIQNIFTNRTCTFRENTEESIEEVQEGLLVTKNCKETILKQNCKNQTITIKRNNLIKFSNCEILLKNVKFSNVVYVYKNMEIIPVLNYNVIKKVNNITLEKIFIQNAKNREKLNYVEEKSEIFNYSIIFIIIIIIISVVITLKLLVAKKRRKNIINNIEIPQIIEMKKKC